MPTIKQYVFKKAAAKRVPVSGTFELTSRCNLNCRMCYIRMTEEEQRLQGRELTTDEWLSVGRQAVDAGMIYLLLTGGEPMIRPDFITIYSEMVKMGVLVSVNTNACAVTPEIVDCFRQYRPETVNVTIYGSSEETYRSLCGSSAGFINALRGIRMLKDAGIRLTLNTTFTSLNLHDMEELVAFAKEMELPIRTAAYVFPKVRNGMDKQTVSLAPEQHAMAAAKFDLLTMDPDIIIGKRNIVRKILNGDVDISAPTGSKASSCMAGRGAFWVCWDGKIYPCGMLPDDRFNVRETAFRDCWSAISEKMPSIFLPAECSSCRFSPICPVCAALAQSLGGDTTAVPTAMCRYIETYAREILRLTEGIEASAEHQTYESDGFNCIL